MVNVTKILLSFIASLLCLMPALKAQVIQNQNFNGCSKPSGWSTTILSGNTDWQFNDNSSGSNPGSFNGSCMAYFDDDALGAGAAPSTVELISPPVNLNGYTSVNLEFDYNYRHTAGSSFKVEVWDGNAWQTVLFVSSNACGGWGTCNYPHATIDVSNFINSQFRVKFTYDDGDSWAWYAGIDNFELSPPPPSCTKPGKVNINANNDSAAISWQAGESQNNTWEMSYGYSGFTPGNGTEIKNITTPEDSVQDFWSAQSKK